ncbi:SET domain [Carpediemonas membranifera]|uniref:SET domain n=1 Tax=Carpediemonas membranifera TaxID=201153 RepID=A0A8J6ARS5_9EUKA|nr:SET domain [Carpediemonas membranifera]|eukprot:KAG9389775.1 SET domain [Carpediemonas membranifera]
MILRRIPQAKIPSLNPLCILRHCIRIWSPRSTQTLPRSRSGELKEAEKDLPPLEPPSWLSTRLTHPSIAVEVQPCLAPDHTDVGRGLIATAAIEPGKLLGIYAGRIVSDEDYHANNSNMVFSFDASNIHVDAGEGEGIGVHLINHSESDTNCQFTNRLLKDLPVLAVESTNVIQAEEFLRISYGEIFFGAGEVLTIARFPSLPISHPNYLTRFLEQYPALKKRKK